MMHRRTYVLEITLLILFSILPAGTPTVPHLYAAPGRAVEPAADIPSTSVVSTITGYAAPEVFGTATYRSSNLQLQSSSTFTYGAATRLRFTTDGDCSKISDTAIRCRPGTTSLEVDTDYRFDVTATATGFIHAITSTSEQPVNQTVELMYPATFTYISANIPPDSHSQNTLYWNRPDTTSFAAEITFDVTRCTTALDTMLVLDGSTSISTNGFRQMQDFAQNLVNTVTIGPDAARFGIVQFGTQGSGRLEAPLTDSTSGLASAIDDLRLMRGATDIQEGLALARTELEAKQRAGVPQVIVLLTDGAHNQPGDPVDEAHLAWQSGIHILTVAVGGADRDHLKAIATNPNYLFTVSDFNGLSVILNTLVQDICNPDGAGPGEDTKPESLTVRSIEPNEGSHDTAIASIIAGTGFDTTSVPNVQLRNAAGRYDLETITVESDTVLQATIPAGLAPGSYELIVTNPDGQQATLANAFTVSAREPVISRVIPAAGYTDQSARVSTLDGSVNEQVIVPAGEVVPGVYQVEVYGYTAAQYRLTAEIGAPSVQLQAAPAIGGKSPTKNKPTAPVVPVSSAPDERAGIPPAPAISASSSIYLPLVVR